MYHKYKTNIIKNIFKRQKINKDLYRSYEQDVGKTFFPQEMNSKGYNS